VLYRLAFFHFRIQRPGKGALRSAQPGDHPGARGRRRSDLRAA